MYGTCTQLGEHFEAGRQAHVLRVPSTFMITLAAGTKPTCAQAVGRLLKHKRCWEVRSVGNGSKGERWYAWAWLVTASARHHLLIRRHLRTGELAAHPGTPGTTARPSPAARRTPDPKPSTRTISNQTSEA